MTRRLLSTAALVLILAAVAPAGEPPRPPRPVVMRGRVVLAASYAGDYGYDLVLPPADCRCPSRQYPLMPTSDAHVRVIHANVRKPREVEVIGDLSVIDTRYYDRYYIAIETIRELP